MAVAWDDLIEPAGELDIALLFPSDTDDGQERLTAYIAAAEAAGATDDAAVAAYAYYRAYMAKYKQELASAASKALVDQGSASKLQAQITGWLDLANAKLAESGITPPVSGIVSSAPVSSYQANAVVRW